MLGTIVFNLLLLIFLFIFLICQKKRSHAYARPFPRSVWRMLPSLAVVVAAEGQNCGTLGGKQRHQRADHQVGEQPLGMAEPPQDDFTHLGNPVNTAHGILDCSVHDSLVGTDNPAGEPLKNAVKTSTQANRGELTDGNEGDDDSILANVGPEAIFVPPFCRHCRSCKNRNNDDDEIPQVEAIQTPLKKVPHHVGIDARQQCLSAQFQKEEQDGCGKRNSCHTDESTFHITSSFSENIRKAECSFAKGALAFLPWQRSSDEVLLFYHTIFYIKSKYFYVFSYIFIKTFSIVIFPNLPFLKSSKIILAVFSSSILPPEINAPLFFPIFCITS